MGPRLISRGNGALKGKEGQEVALQWGRD